MTAIVMVLAFTTTGVDAWVVVPAPPILSTRTARFLGDTSSSRPSIIKNVNKVELSMMKHDEDNHHYYSNQEDAIATTTTATGKNWIQSSLQWGQGLMAGLSLAGVLFLSPPATTTMTMTNPITVGTHVLPSIPFLTPPASWAVEVVEATPSLLADVPAPAPTSSQLVGITVLEEVWTLIDKYFIDRTFGGQDWNQVHESYKENVIKAGNDEGRAVKLVTEMVASLGDKYSRMLDVSQYAAIQKFDLIGVGVTLMPNQNKEIIVGSPPVPKSAADLAGLRVGDHVLAINGITTDGRTAFDIIDQIAENPNAKSVTMTIGRQPQQQPQAEAGQQQQEEQQLIVEDVTMDRAFQEVKDPIRYKISETRSDGTKVGFVRILEFNAIVKTKLEDALRALEQEGANAYVMDLRMNTGGAFQSAIEISSLFMQDKVATYVVDSSGAEIPFKTPKSRLAIDKEDPMVLWIDGTSASASEVLAGALHDNCRAAIMGDKSFGKGLIQAVYGLKNGAGLVLTVARYVTPNGSEIQGIGITPDIKGGVPSLFLPGLSTDTSRVDFQDIAARLDPSMCTVPDVH